MVENHFKIVVVPAFYEKINKTHTNELREAGKKSEECIFDDEGE